MLDVLLAPPLIWVGRYRFYPSIAQWTLYGAASTRHKLALLNIY